METKLTLAEMSGEKKLSPRLDLNEIVFNGARGTYSYVKKLDGLVDVNGKKSFAKEDLGDSINVIFLRIRRKLHQFRKGEKPLSTQEHTSSVDHLTLFGGDKIEKGTNEEFRAKYQGLRTVQIVYCLFRGELVRLIVKGASLGSEVKAKNVHDFYSYISSFKKGGRDGHFYEHETTLGKVSEDGPMGSYFAMNFEEGKKLDNNEMAVVTDKMVEVYNFIVESDSYYQTKNAEQIKKDVDETKEKLPTVEYPEDDEDINPDDIPF